MRLSDQQAGEFATAVRAAIGRADLLLAVDCIHTQLADAIDLQKPRCDASGKCCRFEAYGHRLFITTAEMAAFLTSTEPPGREIADGCPYQIEQRCTVHASRPFGCRIFFCDPAADEWQSSQYERSHEQIKRLHATLAIPYFYVEWRDALRAVLGAVVDDVGVSLSTTTTRPTP